MKNGVFQVLLGLCLILSGAVSSAAVAATAVSDSEAVVAAARAAVETRLSTQYTDVTLTVTGRPQSTLDGTAKREYQVLPIIGRWPRSRFTVMVEERENGQVRHTVPVGFALVAFASSWTYTENVAGKVGAEQLALNKQPVDAASLSGDMVSSMDQLKNLRLRRAVRSGMAVRLSDFESIPDVDNRQQVHVIATAGAITIESTGIAMRAGNKGDIVPIQMAHAQTPVRATITDRGVAHVVP